MPNKTKPATSADAQSVLQLYDFRREAEMRKARNFIANWWPQSADDIVNLAMAWGTPENAWMRQVFTYWDMAAALACAGGERQPLPGFTAWGWWAWGLPRSPRCPHR